MVRSCDLCKVGNKRANISEKKTSWFKTRCNGDKSNIENSKVHYCEDTRQYALAALTNLGHVTPYLSVIYAEMDDFLPNFTYEYADPTTSEFTRLRLFYTFP